MHLSNRINTLLYSAYYTNILTFGLLFTFLSLNTTMVNSIHSANNFEVQSIISAELLPSKSFLDLQNSAFSIKNGINIEKQSSTILNPSPNNIDFIPNLRGSFSSTEQSPIEIPTDNFGQVDMLVQNSHNNNNLKSSSPHQLFDNSITSIQSKPQTVHSITIFPQRNPQSFPTINPFQPNMNQIEYNVNHISSNGITNQQRVQAVKWKDELMKIQFDQTNEFAQKQYNYYQQKYNINSYKEIPFCIVVPTYNNVANDRYLRNMKSILMQNYSNFHIVIIDDASTDQTGKNIQNLLNKQTKITKDRYRIQRNTVQMKAMHNLRRAAMQFCKPQQIFLIVDGDDELVGRQVLKLFNAVFQKEDAWFVYSNFIYTYFNQIGFSMGFRKTVIQSNSYRQHPFITSHLRAFYTQLFRNIKDKDLRGEDGQYYQAANDVAICIPCLEMAHKRVKYLSEITYFYNNDTGQNNHFIRALQQRNNDKKIRRKPHYIPLVSLFQKI